MNVLWVSNCSIHSEPVTSRARWSSGQPADTTGRRHGRHLESVTLYQIDVLLL